MVAICGAIKPHFGVSHFRTTLSCLNGGTGTFKARVCSSAPASPDEDHWRHVGPSQMGLLAPKG